MSDPGGLDGYDGYLLPDARFKGHVRFGRRDWWYWSVLDGATGKAVAWGEEGSMALAQRECAHAVQGFRWFYAYARAGQIDIRAMVLAQEQELASL